MEKIVFGGPHAFKVIEGRNFNASIEEVNEEPAVVIWPRVRRVGVGAFVVCLSAYHQYFEAQSARPTPYAYRVLPDVMESTLGFSPLDRGAFTELLDMLVKCADYVVRMRPDLEQRRKREAMPSYLESVELVSDGQVLRKIENPH